MTHSPAPPRQVSVNLVDLKILVNKMLESEVRRHAETMVITQPGHSDASAAFLFDQLVCEAEPEARKAVERRYRRLLEALESEENVAQALTAFARGGRPRAEGVSRGSTPSANAS